MNPLSDGALCDAVIMIPALHFRNRTAEESRGVDLASGTRNTLTGPAASTRAQSSANSGELCRVSRAITQESGASGPSFERR